MLKFHLRHLGMTRDMGADLLMGLVPGGTARVSGFGRNHTLHL